jgi:hypothetical protein
MHTGKVILFVDPTGATSYVTVRERGVRTPLRPGWERPGGTTSQIWRRGLPGRPPSLRRRA